MATVLITGGRGFLGHLLVQEILRRGELHYAPAPGSEAGIPESAEALSPVVGAQRAPQNGPAKAHGRAAEGAQQGAAEGAAEGAEQGAGKGGADGPVSSLAGSEAGTEAQLRGRQRVVKVVALDQSPVAPHHCLPGVDHIVGDITDEAFMQNLFSGGSYNNNNYDKDNDIEANNGYNFLSVFHLAAVLSGQAEADPDLGMRVNVDATRLLLACCRRTGRRLTLVMTSSVAVFGRPSVSGFATESGAAAAAGAALGETAGTMPGATAGTLSGGAAGTVPGAAAGTMPGATTVTVPGANKGTMPLPSGGSGADLSGGAGAAVGLSEDSPVLPQSSYGAQKAACELLLADARRRGAVDARAVRLPTVVVRPGRPNSATSSFCSSIVREPLRGEPAVCPVSPDLPLWIQSPQTAVRNIVHAHNVDLGPAWPILTLPGLTTTPREMVGALEACGGDASMVEWRRDEFLNGVVSSWPGRLHTPTATRLGFECDPDVLSVVRKYKDQYCS